MIFTPISAGYAGGIKENPTYEETCQKNVPGQHAEVVRVIYWPDKISVSNFLIDYRDCKLSGRLFSVFFMEIWFLVQRRGVSSE